MSMDVPECNVCQVALDEEEHQPHHLGCSHDACTACIKTLINNGSFECPLCRRIIKADKAEDLPINHGVVQVLRLFRNFKMSENKSYDGVTANINEFCSIHKCTSDKRCITCKVWICVQCKKIHIPDIGCKIEEYNEALKTVKKEHMELVEPTVSSIRNYLRSLSYKLAGIESEKRRLDNLSDNLQKTFEDGTKVLNEVVAATTKIDKTVTSKEFNERLHIANESLQFAQIWCKRNTDSSLEKFKSDQKVYGSMVINGKSSHCKMSFEDDNNFLYCFRVKGFNINKSLKIFPYEQLQAWIPAARDLVFFDLAICGQVQGRVTIRLRQDLPAYAKNIPLLFTGEKGHSLLGLSCRDCWSSNLSITVKSITDKINHFNRNANAGHGVTQGAILAWWNDNYLERFYIYHGSDNPPYDSNYDIFGQVETGLDTVKLCRNYKNQDKVTVSECGLVIK